MKTLVPLIGLGFLFMALLVTGCETLQPVQPSESKPAAKPKPEHTEKSQPAQLEEKKKTKRLFGFSDNMGKGGRLPFLEKPGGKPPTTAQGKKSTTTEITILPETDKPLAAKLDDILEKNPVDEKADKLETTVGQIASARITLVQVNNDIKPHYHANHDEILSVVKGKGILIIGEDRHVAAPGCVFILPKRTTYSLIVTGEKPFVALVIELPPADPKDVVNVKVK